MTAVGRFFPCPRTARSLVRVRVRVRPCASYVVLPSFPWRASCFVHDGRRPFFPVSTYSPFPGPCKGPCCCVCLVHGFAHFSMARVTFRPRRASAVFPTCPRTARSRVRVRVRVRPCASYVVLPSFPWHASRFVHDGRRPFFPVSTYSPFTGPCKGPCTCVCLVHGFAHFSMARVPFRPCRPSAVFFHVSNYSPFTGPCKGPCTSVCLVRGFAQFSMARVTFRPWRGRAFFSRVHVQPVHGSV